MQGFIIVLVIVSSFNISENIDLPDLGTPKKRNKETKQLSFTMNILYIIKVSPSQHGACMQLSGVWADGRASCSSSLGRSKESQPMRPYRSHSKALLTDFTTTMSNISSCVLLFS